MWRNCNIRDVELEFPFDHGWTFPAGHPPPLVVLLGIPQSPTRGYETFGNVSNFSKTIHFMDGALVVPLYRDLISLYTKCDENGYFLIQKQQQQESLPILIVHDLNHGVPLLTPFLRTFQPILKYQVREGQPASAPYPVSKIFVNRSFICIIGVMVH